VKAIREKLSSLSEVQLARVYQNVFNTDEGQLVLEHLRQTCFKYVPLPFGEEGQRAEGRRQIILQIEASLIVEEKKGVPRDEFQETDQGEEA